MVSYHIFFTPKEGIDDDEAAGTVRDFFEHLKGAGKLRAYRIQRVTDPASFPELLRFHAIADYASTEAMDASFDFTRQSPGVHEGPHGRVVAMAAQFKVAFTADA